MTRDEILDTAKDMINGDRAKDYGDATANFERIAAIWSVVLNRTITRKEVALCMAGLKIARLARSPDHDDSWVDLAGYAALGGEV